MTPMILGMPGNQALAAALSAHMGVSPAPLEVRSFPDGESYVRVGADPADCTAVIVCTLDRPDDKLVRLGLLAAHLRDEGARHCVLVAPYLPYLRQDRAFHPGECISARHVLGAVAGLFDALVTVDPHLHRIPDLESFMGIPVRLVHSAPGIAAWIRQEVGDALVIGPDAESRQWVEAVARLARLPSAVCEKHRTGDRSVELALPADLPIGARTPVIVDDIVSSATTMIAVARALADRSTARPVCVAVHAIFSGDAEQDLLKAGVARIVSANTVAHSTNGIDLTIPIAEALEDVLGTELRDR